MAFYRCGNGNSGSSSPGELLFHAEDNSVNNDEPGVRNDLTITRGNKFGEYLSYDSTTGRFTVLKSLYLVIVLYSYNNPQGTRLPDATIGVNGSETDYLHLQGTSDYTEFYPSTFYGQVEGGADSEHRKGGYINLGLKQGDYFTLNAASDAGWPVIGAYGYLLCDYIDENLLTKFSD